MFSSRPAVHPVEAPPLTDATDNHPPRVRMKDVQGMPGTCGGLALRVFQFLFAAAALGVMVSTTDFTSVTSFRVYAGGLALSVFQFLFAAAAFGVMVSTTDFTSVISFRVRVYAGGLALLVFQFLFAAAVLGVMVSTTDITSATSFRYLVAVMILQCFWSLSLAFLDIYALLVKRSLRNPRLNFLFAVGDGMTSTLTFAAACASAGITVLIGNDLNICSVNHCAIFETATAMAFISWFAVSPSFLLNFWSLASR